MVFALAEPIRWSLRKFGNDVGYESTGRARWQSRILVRRIRAVQIPGIARGEDIIASASEPDGQPHVHILIQIEPEGGPIQEASGRKTLGRSVQYSDSSSAWR